MRVRVKYPCMLWPAEDALLELTSHQKHAGNTKWSFFGSGWQTSAGSERGGKEFHPSQGSASSCRCPSILAGWQRPCTGYHMRPGNNQLTWVHSMVVTPTTKRVYKAGEYCSLSFLLRAMGEEHGYGLLITLGLFYTLSICLRAFLEAGLDVLSGAI